MVGGVAYLRWQQDRREAPAVTTRPAPEPSRTVTETKVVVYEGPSLLESSDRVKVFVEGHELFVYETLVNNGRLFSFTTPTTTTPVALFDFEGSVNVTVRVDEAVTDAVVRPLAYGITPEIDGNTITFRLDYPGQYTVEYNGRTDRALHLFANPLEQDAPDPDNLPADTIYIGPGVYKADAIPVRSGQTIYIAGGAVVYGHIRAERVENVTIRGRGILDGSIYPRTRPSEFTLPIELRHSKNITIEGITILNPAGWAITSYFVDGLTIDNVKIITARANGDGVSLQSSKNVVVKNSFVRSWDDALVVKNYDRGTSSDILFENIVIWSDLAQSMEVGYETYGETMEKIEFRDITVLHSFHKPVMSIHNADDAHIRDVAFRNITVEDAQMEGDNKASDHDNFFLDFTIQYSQEWSRSGGQRGRISGVVVDNVVVLDGRDDFVSRIMGSGPDNRVEDVLLRNITYKQVPVRRAEDLRLSANQHTTHIRVEYVGGSTGAALHLPYVLDLEDGVPAQVTVVPRRDQAGFLVPDFAIRPVPQVYMGERLTGALTVTATRGTSTLEWDDGRGPFADPGHPASAALDGDPATGWVGLDWPGAPGEFAALSIWFDEPKRVGTVRLHGDPASRVALLQNIALFGIRATSERNVFTRILNSADYEFSPATGNVVDIRINPGEYKALQLRFYNRSGTAYSERAFAHEVEIYPASLTFNKPVSASPHEDVYVASNMTDGNPLTYYEARKGEWPAVVTVDLGDAFDVKVVQVALPPLMQWEPRTQTFSIHGSLDGDVYEEVVPAASYTFDPAQGNLVEITLARPTRMRLLRLVVTDNTSPGGYGAQISELLAFD
ncbi:discoidin domain-containing protein [Geochorda subterranea]|uniref:Discoidin domain-containing protein n=1 Tax=Geochorda subterranea TaxID=3109564 RepID=A0ABZ1BLW3_9FIRM|nr:discoidin domain-containing protein [Limnochorda sp. LNt]WRP13811.1 discoidin domain-containing protein [Limnochorda sp. LNt]